MKAADVTGARAVQRVAADVARRLGSVSILVTNAGCAIVPQLTLGISSGRLNLTIGRSRLLEGGMAT